jgi:hypothetical protein
VGGLGGSIGAVASLFGACSSAGAATAAAESFRKSRRVSSAKLSFLFLACRGFLPFMGVLQLPAANPHERPALGAVPPGSFSPSVHAKVQAANGNCSRGQYANKPTKDG